MDDVAVRLVISFVNVACLAAAAACLIGKKLLIYKNKTVIKPVTGSPLTACNGIQLINFDLVNVVIHCLFLLSGKDIRSFFYYTSR